MSADQTWDVAVIGGGPAGCAAALSLRQRVPRSSVVLLEASGYDSPRIGEVLPAAALPILRQLDVLGQFHAAGFAPSNAVFSAWGSGHAVERHALYSAMGGGWHLDRCAFDGLLAQAAEDAGAELRRHAAVRALRREPGQGWTLDLGGQGKLKARQLIWACGRNWRLARYLSARVRVHDGLTAYIRFFSAAGSAVGTMVESRPEGWWYTANLPGARRVVACVTESDIARALGIKTAEGWYRGLAQTKLISSCAIDARWEIDRMVRTAGLVTTNPVFGPDWIAAGDSAFAPDPLSSQGIVRALRSGMFAAYAVADGLDGAASLAGARYAAILRQDIAAYRQAQQLQYLAVGHWPTSDFWKRRAGGAEGPSHLGTAWVELGGQEVTRPAFQDVRKYLPVALPEP